MIIGRVGKIAGGATWEYFGQIFRVKSKVHLIKLVYILQLYLVDYYGYLLDVHFARIIYY